MIRHRYRVEYYLLIYLRLCCLSLRVGHERCFVRDVADRRDIHYRSASAYCREFRERIIVCNRCDDNIAVRRFKVSDDLVRSIKDIKLFLGSVKDNAPRVRYIRSFGRPCDRIFIRLRHKSAARIHIKVIVVYRFQERIDRIKLAGAESEFEVYREHLVCKRQERIGDACGCEDSRYRRDVVRACGDDVPAAEFIIHKDLILVIALYPAAYRAGLCFSHRRA